jgi:hypothetical protein
MVLSSYIQKLIRNKVGNHLTLSSQFCELSKDIFEVTGKNLSVNTLKRLFGMQPYVRTSSTTLNILAEYLGFDNWEQLNCISENGNSCLCVLDKVVFIKDMDNSTTIEVLYEPARKLLLKVIDSEHCLILSANGGKLKDGDILAISEIAVDHSFFVSDVERGGHKLGQYIGGIEGGVKSIKII